MKHLKKYNEGFLDYFKKDTNDDKITLDMIHRLEKVKDENPYEIYEAVSDGQGNSTNFPAWVANIKNTIENGVREETYSKIYVVRFDDVDVLISNDRHTLINNLTGEIAGYKKCVNKWKMFIGNNNGLAERIRSKESYRIKLFNIIENLYKEKKRKRKN